MHTNASKVVHETETQRQHARWAVPAQAILQGQRHEVKNLSAGGCCLAGVTRACVVGARLELTLLFPFSDFTLSLDCAAEVRHADAALGTLGCAFTNLESGQVALLSHVLRAFAAGDCVAAGDVLAVAARDNFTKPRGSRPPPDPRRQWPGLAAIALVGLAALSFIGVSLRDGLFRVEARNAWVEAPRDAGEDPWIVAEAEGDDALRFDAGARVVARVFGVESPYAARIADARIGPRGPDGHRRVILRVETERPLAAALSGRPVFVVIHAGPP